MVTFADMHEILDSVRDATSAVIKEAHEMFHVHDAQDTLTFVFVYLYKMLHHGCLCIM